MRNDEPEQTTFNKPTFESPEGHYKVALDRSQYRGRKFWVEDSGVC